MEVLDYYHNYFSGKISGPGNDAMFSKSSLPSLSKKNVDFLLRDPDLKMLLKSTIEDIPAHRMKLFLTDNTAMSYGEMSASIMIGENVGITVEKSKTAKEVIEAWCDNINVKHQTVEKFIKSVFLDNLMNMESLWRVWVNLDAEEGDPIVDIQRVSMLGLKREEHPTKGYMRWIQYSMIPKKQMGKQQFYKRNPTQILEYQTAITIIPNELNCAIYANLFEVPPTSTILVQLLLKKWAYWFLRKFMEKYWAPFIIASVGDFKNGFYPKNKEEWKESLSWAADQIRRIRDFGGAAFPAHTALQVLDTKSLKNANLYIDTIDHLSKEIAIGLYASISTRDSGGKSKAGQDIAQEGYLRNMRSIRQEIAIILKKFWAKVLLPAHGINSIKPRDIKITFPELKLDDTKSTLEAIEKAAKIGVFKDFKEIRKILNPIWKHIDENITPKEEALMKKTFMEINSPSRAEGDSPQSRAGSSAKPTSK